MSDDAGEREAKGRRHVNEAQGEKSSVEVLLMINHNLARIADSMGAQDALTRIEGKLDVVLEAAQRIIKLEVKQMAFAQDVLDRITRQTTLIGSIKVWIQNLPTDVVSAEEKAAILANLDQNEAELSTAIPANVPPVA